MATYVFGLTASDVAGVIAHEGGIGSGSDPTDTQATTWIKQFAAEFAIAFRDRHGLSASVLTEADYPEQYDLVRGRIAGRAAAEWLRWNQRADDNETIDEVIRSWLGWLQSVRAGELGSIGTSVGGDSMITGTFSSRRIITTPSSREPRRPASSRWWGR